MSDFGKGYCLLLALIVLSVAGLAAFTEFPFR